MGILYWRKVMFIGVDQFSGKEGSYEPSIANLKQLGIGSTGMEKGL